MTKIFKAPPSLNPNGLTTLTTLKNSSQSTRKIPKHLLILFCIPHNKTSYHLFQKRNYCVKKVNFSLDPLASRRVLNRTKKTYITSLEVFAKKYFRYLDINKSLKSLREVRFIAYTKDPGKTIAKAWHTIHTHNITSLAIESSSCGDSSAVLKVISYHKNLKDLIYERLYNNFTIVSLFNQDASNIYYSNLVETLLSRNLKTLHINVSLLRLQDVEPFILKFKGLTQLDLESNSEMEDESLRKLALKLKDFDGLSKTSLIFSECYSQQFLLNLLTELGEITELRDLTISIPLGLEQYIKSPLVSSNQFRNLEALNLILSQTDRGYDHCEMISEGGFYEFFSQVSFPFLRHFRVHLESTFITKSSSLSSDALGSFLKFLSSLNQNLESLHIRFWGPSLEYFQWEKILNIISTLQRLRDLELSEISFFNNFCIGLITKVISSIKGLRRLWLRPVNVMRTKYLKSFVDAVVTHETLSSLCLMVNKFFIELAERLLRKLKEFSLKTNCDGGIEEYRELFRMRIRSSILAPAFFSINEW